MCTTVLHAGLTFTIVNSTEDTLQYMADAFSLVIALQWTFCFSNKTHMNPRTQTLHICLDAPLTNFLLFQVRGKSPKILDCLMSQVGSRPCRKDTCVRVTQPWNQRGKLMHFFAVGFLPLAFLSFLAFTNLRRDFSVVRNLCFLFTFDLRGINCAILSVYL